MESDSLFACEGVNSPDYVLIKTLKQFKTKLLTERRHKRQSVLTSSALRLLQREFSDAIVRMQQEKTEFSIFVVDNLEKLLNTK